MKIFTAIGILYVAATVIGLGAYLVAYTCDPDFREVADVTRKIRRNQFWK